LARAPGVVPGGLAHRRGFRAQQGSRRRDRDAPDAGRAGVGRRGVRRRITPEAATATALLLCSTMRSAARHLGDPLCAGNRLLRPRFTTALVGSTRPASATGANEASGRPGALRRRALLRTGGARFRASGSSEPWQIRWRHVLRSALEERVVRGSVHRDDFAASNLSVGSGLIVIFAV